MSYLAQKAQGESHHHTFCRTVRKAVRPLISGRDKMSKITLQHVAILSNKDDTYSIRCESLPDCLSSSDTIEKAIEDFSNVVKKWVVQRLSEGLHVPVLRRIDTDSWQPGEVFLSVTIDYLSDSIASEDVKISLSSLAPQEQIMPYFVAA
jgi:predicted RNase H-like HicB family nuclease